MPDQNATGQMALPPGATLVDSGGMKLPPGASSLTRIESVSNHFRTARNGRLGRSETEHGRSHQRAISRFL